jgi:hypothetical protein
MVTLKNVILKYIGMNNILKRKCHVGINVVFIEVIATVWCMIHEKHVHYHMIMFASFLIWDRQNLFEGRSPITLRGRREKGMYYFFSSTFNFFFNYLVGVISLWLMTFFLRRSSAENLVERNFSNLNFFSSLFRFYIEEIIKEMKIVHWNIYFLRF